jgi:hypothetical protein
MGNSPVKGAPGRDVKRSTPANTEDSEDVDSIVNSSGVGGDDLPELNVNLARYSFEETLSRKYPNTIVLGRDRAGAHGSERGYGLISNTECHSVDIVIGRKACDENFDIQNNQGIPPDFINDAARIYVSNRSDIDQYYLLPAGKNGDSIKRSSVSAKADVVRLIGREGIKLVAGTDQKNSQRETVVQFAGIELMAGDLEKCNRVMVTKDSREQQITEIGEGGMQPIPLGVNTVFALDQIVDKIDGLAATVSTFAMRFNMFLNGTAQHTHFDTVNEFFGLPSLPSQDYLQVAAASSMFMIERTITDLKLLRGTLKTFKADHLKPSGPYYINSKYHTLN